MGFIEGLPAPKRIRDPLFSFQNLSSLDISSQWVNFEGQSIEFYLCPSTQRTHIVIQRNLHLQ